MEKFKTKYWYYVGIALIVILALFMHLFRLDQLPYGLHIDEASMAYNAWSLANYGVDRYLKSFPVYFINFGGGQSVLYAYLTAFFIKISGGGLSLLAIRLPAVLSAFATMFFGYKIVNLKWNDKKLNLLFLFLFTIIPYFTMQSRFGLDCNLLLGISTIFLYFGIKAFQEDTVKYYVICGIVGGITLYSYALSYIIVPMFLGLTFIYLLRIGKLKLKNMIALGIPLLILATPLILVQIINTFDLPEMQLGLFTITKMPVYRSSDIVFTAIPEYFVQALKSIFFYDHLPYNTLPKIYTMYAISIPFILLGMGHAIVELFDSLSEKKENAFVLILLWVLPILLLGCVINNNANRLNGIFFGLLFFLVKGFALLLQSSAKWKNKLMSVSLVIYAICFINFGVYYFGDYSKEYNPLIYFKTYCGNALNAIPQEIIDNHNIFVDMNYVYYIGEEEISPYDVNLPEKGEGVYLNYNFNLPHTVEEISAAYIIHWSNTGYLQALIDAGYYINQYDDYYLCYMQ